MIDQKIWNVLRPEIRWVAMDKCGNWCGHERKPDRGSEAWGLGGARFDLKAISLPADIYWRESLHERPVEPQAEKPYVVDDAHRAYVCAIMTPMLADFQRGESALEQVIIAAHRLARALREAEKTV